jgi:hypothetical protein
LADIADRFNVHQQVIMQENDMRPGSGVQSGHVLLIPMTALGPFLYWRLHLVGLVGTLVGVSTCLWLAILSGLLPADSKPLIIVISLSVAVIHYVVQQMSACAVPAAITPLFVLSSLKDGFAWSAILILLPRAFGSTPASA